MSLRVNSWFWLLKLMLTGSVTMAVGQESNVLRGEFWKQQGLQDVLPHWEQHAVDAKNGGFYTYLSRDWKRYKKGNKYPGMQARHLYSYSVAYMLSGDQKYLDKARSHFQYLIQHGWDDKYGGWYDAIDSTGNPVKTTKDLFMQTYANTGCALYYMASLDTQAYHYWQKGNDIIRHEAHDRQNDGYYRTLNRDLSVKTRIKEFTPNIAPISGYLAYMYPFLQDAGIRLQWWQQMTVARSDLPHPQKKWIRESFTHDWEPFANSNKKANIGHNVEVVWLLLRHNFLMDDYNNMATGREKALQLYKLLNQYALDTSSGVWYNWVMIDNPAEHSQESSWWVQAYGNMTHLYLYRVTQNKKYLRYFKRGARFWNDHFMDSKHGAAVLKVDLEGNITKGAKAVRSKTSYHSMEHSLLNYLYVRLWVEEKPVTLYYHVAANHQRDTIYPLPIEDPQVNIQSVALNGKPWNQFDASQGSVTLPENRSGKLKVVFEPKMP